MKNKASKISLIKKGFSISIRNIWRNKVLSLATIFVIGIIIFIFNIILAVNFIANESISNISQKIDLTVYLKETTNYQDVELLKTEISKLEGVTNVTYTSKEDALQSLQSTHPNISVAFEKYELGNPLPASLSINTTHPKYHQEIAKFLEQDIYKKYLSNIITNNENDDNKILTNVSKNLLELTNFANQIIFWLIITFIIGGALIILNALQITIFSRKKEISIMQIVGAPYWFIKLPFIIESIIYGILAVTTSFILLIILSKNIAIQDSNIWAYYKDIKFYITFLIELIFTILLSVTSSLIAVHEYLRKHIN